MFAGVAPPRLSVARRASSPRPREMSPRVPKCSENAEPATPSERRRRTRLPRCWNGIMGRQAGLIDGFNCSESQPGPVPRVLVWTEEVMPKYLENPMSHMPGTKMAFAGRKEEKDSRCDRLSEDLAEMTVGVAAGRGRRPEWHRGLVAVRQARSQPGRMPAANAAFQTALQLRLTP